MSLLRYMHELCQCVNDVCKLGTSKRKIDELINETAIFARRVKEITGIFGQVMVGLQRSGSRLCPRKTSFGNNF